VSFFSGIGDFFRGAFGEDDEEKRRRKDRERRESQQRAQKSQQSRRSVAPKTNDFFSKNSKAQSNPFGIPIDKPKTETNNPDPFKATLDAKKSLSPKEDFRDFRQKEGKNKTILGFNAAALLPKSLEKEYKYEAEGTVNIEKEKYLEGFDKLSESGGVKQAYVADLQKKAENDPLAAKTLKLLENNGRMKGGLEQFARGSNEKLAGGLTRGLARGADQLLPGRNTFGLERFADDQEGPKEFTRAGQKGEQFGSIQKGLVDLATIAIPGSKLDKMADGTKIIKALQKGGNLSKVAGKTAAVLPGSIYGTGADYLQTKGRGDDQNLAKSAAVGTGLDVGLSLLPAGIGALIRKARGNQALDVVDDKLLKGISDELKDDVARKPRGVDTIEAPQVGKTDGLRDVPIADFKNTDTTSWNEAIQNVNKGELSKTNGPVEVVLTKNGYKLVEGNHRAVQALNNGDTTIKAKIISKEGLDEIAKRDGPHIKMGMQDSYTQKQLDAHFSTPAPQVGKTDPQASLKQEARKYKSAEEFVNSQKPVYHGTNADLTDISQLQSGRQRGEYSNGTRSVFASENPELASKYGKNVLEGRNTGKVLDTTKLGDPYDPNKLVVPKEFSDYKTNPLLDATDKRVLENSYFKGGTPSNIVIDHKPNIQEYFKSKGYSAIQIPRASDVAGSATEMTIIDPTKVKTRQQLTDLYNQAHAKHQAPEAPKAQAPDPTAALKQEARKYETAKEFALVHSNEKQRLRLDDLSAVETSDKSVDWGFDQRKAPPIIVDQHGQILDGHHRYYAAKEAFEKDAKLYNEGKVNHIYMEQKWGDVNFGEIDAVVKNKENLGKGWAQEKKSDNLTYDQLTDLYNQATQSQPPKSPIESLKDATPNSTVVRDIERGLDNAIPAPSNATHNLDAARERISKQIEDINNITRSHVEGIQRTPTLSVGDKTKLTEEVANKYRAVRADLDNTLAKTTSQVDEAGKAIDTAQTARQEVIGEVQQAKAATPEVGTKAAGVADVETGPSVNDLVFKDAPKFEEKGRSILQTLSPDRVVRENITNPAEQYLKGKVAKAQTSENALSRGLGRLFQGKSREAGVGSELLTAKMKRRGAADLGKLQRETIADIGKELDEASKTKVWAVLDPEQAAKLGVAPGSLNPAEAAYMSELKEVIDANTQALLSRNLITPEEAANPSYIKRAYGAFELDRELKGAYDASRSDLIKQFKGRKDVDAEGLLETGITDPSWLVAKKAAETQTAVGMVDYGNYLVDSGIAKDFPAPGLVQMPESKLHGGASGKWVPKNVSEDITGFKYTMGWLNAYDELVTHYDNWAVRRGKKALLTIFNPAVRGTNQMSNRVLFSQLNGINPVQFNAAYAQVGKMMKSNHQIYREAVEYGLTGVDITAADFAKRIGDSTGSGNLAARGIDWVKSTYSRADDKAKIAAFMVHRNRGYSAEEAARLTQRGFQDYNSVGYFYDLAAKTPLIGNAFVRFASDSTRIAKNAALDHPMRTIATVAVWAKFVDQMSKMSGESAEDKATREGRFGAPKVPFTDISMTVQTPWGEVNAARFMPFYQLNNIGSPLSKTLPISGNPLQPEGWQDPLLGQFAQIAKDEDFRGKSIQDPDNVKFGDGTTKFEMDPLSADEKRKNVFRFLFNNNAPAGREVDSLFSSLGKEPIDGVIGDSGGEDIYGKKRTPAQAVLRALGVKVEQFGEEQAQEARQTEDYFKRKEEIDRDVEGLDPKTQAAFRRLTGMYKLRDEKDNPFKEGGKINVKAPVYDFSEQKYGEYMQSPELFKLMEKRARMEAEANDAPLNPIFDPRLPESFRLQLIQQKSIAPGDDIELQDRMYEDPLWDTYKAIQDEYKAKGAAYYPESNGEFTDEMVKHQDAPWAEKPPLWKAYTDAKARGEDPQWSDELAAVREKFEMDKLNWTNNERKARGLPPIPAEQWFNKTFGYSPEKTSSGYSSGYSRGYGGGGGGGSSSRQNDTNKLNNIANTTVSSPLDYIQPKDMPAIQALLRKLEAGGGGRKATPKLGAASRGTG
jgi:hypothetical protein